MPARSPSAYDKRIREIAEDYKQRGYRVTVAPSVGQLPEFLKDYSPDLVAEGPDDSIVVEVKSPGKGSRTDHWAELARTLQQHPGWRLELVVDGEQHRKPPTTIEQFEIESRLEDGRRLAGAGMLDAALLITWSATEAAMRLASKRHRLDLPDFRLATIISRLYSDGVIEREEYDLLMRSMQLRNTVAHGFRHDQIDAESIEQLRRFASRLLQSSE